MGTKIFLSIVTIAAPLMMAVIGRVFMKSAPKTINPIFGYRTTMSMKNEDTWGFAHDYCGRLWFVCGLVFAALIAALLAFSFNKDLNSFGTLASALCFLCIGGMLWSIFLTERALKETFDENGERRATILSDAAVTALETETAPVAEPVALSDDIDSDDNFFEATVAEDTEQAVDALLEDIAEESIFDE